MREIHRSAIVPYPAESMFELVADIDSYKEFVPGCTDSCIESREDGEVVASLGLAHSGQIGHFTTRNRLRPPTGIHMTLVEGPFTELEGDWTIESLGDEGCRLDLRMRFAFASRLRDMLLGPIFERTCNHLVDAFVKRAHQLYG